MDVEETFGQLVDRLAELHALDQLVDQVRYAPGGEDGWPDRRPGQAAELLEPAGDNRDGAGWVAGRDEYGDGGQGTPGRATR